MKILVIGSGGREHALAWKLSRSARVHKVLVAPGNPGTARELGVENVPVTDIAGLVELARNEAVGLTVVGPEAPLAEGVVDAFRAAGLPIFGPSRAAAQLESSKDFAKQFLVRHGIPTAKYQTFADAASAHAYLDAEGAPIVIKADGLAAGKGVVVAMSLEQAHQAVDMMLVDNRMGGAGARVVIEEFMQGEEASFIVMADGRNALALATSQDHKRLEDGDQGPNTGGMGAYSPAPVVTPEVHARVMREVIMPTLNGMAADGIPYSGFLYAGLMIDPEGRFFDNTAGRHRYGPRILDVGVQAAWDGVAFSMRKFIARDGLYAYARGRRIAPGRLTRRHRLIVLTGPSGSGKDTVAELLRAYEYQRVAIADPLKRGLRALIGLTDAQLWGDRRNEALPELGVSPRRLMQVVSDALLELDPKLWIRRWRRELEERLDRGELVVCTDVRTCEELGGAYQLGATTVRIVRAGAAAPGVAATHRTETELSELDDDCFDVVLHNDGTLEELRREVRGQLLDCTAR